MSVLTNAVPIHSQHGWARLRFTHVDLSRVAGGWGREERISKGAPGRGQWGKIGRQRRKRFGVRTRSVILHTRGSYVRAGRILQRERNTTSAVSRAHISEETRTDDGLDASTETSAWLSAPVAMVRRVKRRFLSASLVRAS